MVSWAYQWLLSKPNVKVVLTGSSSLEQFVENVSLFNTLPPLSEKESAVIDDAIRELNAIPTVPCTGCRYCMDCPSGVEIPTVFSLYNQYALNQNKEVFDEIDATARAEQCIACGQCMEHCPQSIPIPEKMAMIAELIQS